MFDHFSLSNAAKAGLARVHDLANNDKPMSGNLTTAKGCYVCDFCEVHLFTNNIQT